MREITLEELLEAGCHFGHQVTRSNPKARDFVFEARDNIHIIDLAKTKEGLEEGANFIKNLASNGGKILVVATKRQAQNIVMDEIKRVKEEYKSKNGDTPDGLFYITYRWVGGILTNISEVSKNFKKLEDLKSKLQDTEEKAKYTKREVGLWEKEKQRLELLYVGISTMTEKPDAMFIIDSHLEDLSVREAQNMGVKTVAIVDTNADPLVIDYPIPANDDAVGSIKLISSYILDAWLEGKKNPVKVPAKQNLDSKPKEVPLPTSEALPAGELKQELKQETVKTESSPIKTPASQRGELEVQEEKPKEEVKAKAKTKQKVKKLSEAKPASGGKAKTAKKAPAKKSSISKTKNKKK